MYLCIINHEQNLNAMTAVQKFLAAWDNAEIVGCKKTYQKARKFLRMGGLDTETHNRIVGVIEWHYFHELV